MCLALQSSRISQAVLLAIFLFSSGLETRLAGQSTNTAQLTGVVPDAPGSVVPGTKVMLTIEHGAVAWVVGN